MHEAALAAEAVYWNMQKASQSLRPQAQRKFRAFFPMTCASEKKLLGSQTCERKRVRCGEPLSPLKQTPQRSGVCLNQQKAERRNAVPLLPSDSQPGERTAAGWRIARKGRNERERNNWRDSSVLLRPTVCILPEIPRSFLNRLCYF